MISDHFNCLRSNGQEKLESIKQLQAQVADGEGQSSELATAAGSGAWVGHGCCVLLFEHACGLAMHTCHAYRSKVFSQSSLGTMLLALLRLRWRNLCMTFNGCMCMYISDLHACVGLGK